MIPGERHMECAYYFDFCRLCRLGIGLTSRGAGGGSESWHFEARARNALANRGC